MSRVKGHGAWYHYESHCGRQLDHWVPVTIGGDDISVRKVCKKRQRSWVFERILISVVSCWNCRVLTNYRCDFWNFAFHPTADSWLWEFTIVILYDDGINNQQRALRYWVCTQERNTRTRTSWQALWGKDKTYCRDKSIGSSTSYSTVLENLPYSIKPMMLSL